MNKAISEGLALMPPAFADGLDVWSSEDGRPGSVTYETNAAGVLFSADADFGDCLEIVKEETPQKLRHMGETPFQPGCYLEVSARVKAISGPLPQVRIAAWPGDATGAQVTGIDQTATLVKLDEYNRVYEIRAIIGSGARTGVDLVWGRNPVFAHVGIDIIGSNGSVTRVESIQVEDKTSIYHRDLLDVVDVLDYGARGDGVTNNVPAFELADAAAGGRTVIVPPGEYFLGNNVTMLSPVRFQGTVTMDADRRLILRRNFDLPTYAAAFGDETEGLKRGLQALFNFTDHEAFDLGGRRVDLTEPIDVHAAVGNVDVLSQRRVIRNGALVAEDTSAWDPDVVTATANYDTADPLKLTNVGSIGSIAIGSLVEGFGVGREVYVRSKNNTTGELTLSQPLYRANASQSYTFTRNKYMLDFSGFTSMRSFTLDAIEFQGEGRGNGVMLSEDGNWWFIRNCWFFQCGVRSITSFAESCQGITVEQCEFVASDAAEPISDRTSVAMNFNKNDGKIRDNRIIDFRHFCVTNGTGNIFIGNHFWQADGQTEGEKTAGLVLTNKRSKTTITGNYMDNQFIEFTNEHQVDADNSANERFGRVSIIGNVFTAVNVPSWFTFIRISPTGTDHRLDGISVIGNTFQLFGGSVIDRVEDIDTSTGTIDHTQTRDLVFEGNGYGSVATRTASPLLLSKTQNSNDATWVVGTGGRLPFEGFALGADSVTAHGPIQSSSGTHAGMPWVTAQNGANSDQIVVNWSAAVSGRVEVRVRSDRAD